MRRVEKLVSAWGKGVSAISGYDLAPVDPVFAASTEPRERARTPLSDKEVDEIRTLRGAGVPVKELARRYGVHRNTISQKTRPASSA
jgi:hypothetical protein